MSEETHSCPSCGARIPEGADTCNLCGHRVNPQSEGSENQGGSNQAPASSVPEHDPGAKKTSDSVYCHDCGWENPADANFCSQCGSELETTAPKPDSARPVTADLPKGPESEGGSEQPDASGNEGREEHMTKQLLLMVGGGVALVLALFFATQWSQQYEWGGGSDGEGGRPGGAAQTTSPSGSGGDGMQRPSSATSSQSGEQRSLQSLVESFSGAVDGPLAGEIDSLRSLEEEAEGPRRRQLRSKLVELYTGAGAPGRAALWQEKVADATNAVEDRRRAADLMYKWMRQVQSERGRAEVSQVARHVADAYAAVVEQQSQDLDARTRMGEAYLLTNNPMKGIQAINAVLDEDSTFVPARFQKGLALLQINRLDDAVRQFQKVMTHATEADPFYKQAKRAVEVIREERSSAADQGSGGTGG